MEQTMPSACNSTIRTIRSRISGRGAPVAIRSKISHLLAWSIRSGFCGPSPLGRLSIATILRGTTTILVCCISVGKVDLILVAAGLPWPIVKIPDVMVVVFEAKAADSAHEAAHDDKW